MNNNGQHAISVEKDSNRILVFFDYMSDVEFWLKITFSCVFFQWVFASIFAGVELTILQKITVYWVVNVGSFYLIAYTIENVIKKNPDMSKTRCTRDPALNIQSQPYVIQMKRTLLSLAQSFVISALVILLLREVERGVHFVWSFAWFFMSIVVTDFAFYAHHRWLLHNKRLRRFLKIHAEHHRYHDSSGFVTGHKNFSDMVINFVLADMVVLILFGFDFNQLLAWTLVINLFNIEGHSAISLLYIGTDFHDKHHTHVKGNYGIHGMFDRIFGTFINGTRKTGILFPANTLGEYYLKRQKIGLPSK